MKSILIETAPNGWIVKDYTVQNKVNTLTCFEPSILAVFNKMDDLQREIPALMRGISIADPSIQKP